MKIHNYEWRVEKLPQKEIYVFLTDVFGTHTYPSANHAIDKFGAKPYRLQNFASKSQLSVTTDEREFCGQSYGLPVVYSPDIDRLLDIEEMRYYMARFFNYAICNPRLEFIVVPTSSTRFDYRKIAKNMVGLPDNVVVPETWAVQIKRFSSVPAAQFPKVNQTKKGLLKETQYTTKLDNGTVTRNIWSYGYVRRQRPRLDF